MAVPVTIERIDYDGWGYWPDGVHSSNWVVDITATYTAGKNWPKRRLTWFFKRSLTVQQVIDEVRRLANKRKSNIVFVGINKIWPPVAALVTRLIDKVNEQLQRECRQNARAAKKTFAA